VASSLCYFEGVETPFFNMGVLNKDLALGDDRTDVIKELSA